MILFRTEASRTIGTGHLMRCLALAEICLEQGKNAIFVMSECPKALATRLKNIGIETVMLDDGSKVDELLALITQLQPTGIVIDGYQFNEHYRRPLFESGLPVVAMDDGTMQHPLHADVVVNVSPLASAADYETIAADAHLLLGPSYASLRGEFRHCKDAAKSISAKEHRILISFGGSDPLNLTLPVIEALIDKLPEQVMLDVVIGGAAAGDDKIDQLAQKHAKRIQLHKNTLRMAELMQHATMAIAAAGSTLWELAFLTVPTIAIVVADNQSVMLESPMSSWFNTIDARPAIKDPVEQIATVSQTLWKNDKARENSRMVLSQIKVGDKVINICKTFDKIFKRPA